MLSDLQSVQAEWLNSQGPISVTIADIEGLGSGGLNGTSFLQLGITVFDDDAVDQVFGDSNGGIDSVLESPLSDVLNRTKQDDVVTSLS